MAEIGAPSVAKADFDNLAAAVSGLQAAASGFVNNGAYLTVAALLSGFPASATTLGKYARVSDLYSGAKSVMVCEGSTDGTAFYWRPQRTDYSVANTATTGAQTLTPLLHAPVQVFTGTLTGALTVTPSATNAWPGAQFTLFSKGLLGIFGISISGLIGGALPLIAGGTRTLTYTSTGWQGA